MSTARRAAEYVVDKSIIQGILALILVGVTSYMFATGMQVGEALISLTSMVLGFYFRSATSSPEK